MSRDQAIAIVGIGCQYPGNSDSSDSFWEFLNSGEDGVIPVPQDRWDWRRVTANENPVEAGRTYLKEGGFLQHDIFDFDAAFFGISSREAETLDIQQRLLLEVSYQAIEDAGLSYSTQEARNVGVFMGGFTLDNMVSRSGSLSRDSLESTDAMGATMSLLANRLSYTYNFIGPSLSLDTACSSSLVAVHLACESILKGDCPVALAGGVNVMLNPEASILMSRGGFLSPTCRCHSFDSAADGYVRAEGAGVVVLKDYQQALADGDVIHAVIRATGVSHDGKTAGVALPNSKAQEVLMKSVCREAAVDPAQLDYVEAHGTGTKAGDQAEIESIHHAYNAFGDERSQPLVVGSVKSKFGHAEAAAGVAGLIKAVLVLKHGVVPPQLHFDDPSPDLKLKERGIIIPSVRDSCSGFRFKWAGVNSFGYGGTNAHAVLEAAEPRPTFGTDVRSGFSEKSLRIVPLSAYDKAALSELADRTADRLEQVVNDTDLSDWAYSQASRRVRLSQGLSLPFTSREAMIEQLRVFSREGDLSEGMFHGPTTCACAKGIVFVCTGMGPQWWGMGRALYEESPCFRETAQRCDEIFKDLAGWSILEEMIADEASSKMVRTEIAQPANVVLQIALAAVLEEAGITPSVVVGHSVGEVTAAYLSGSLSLEDTMCVSYHRSRLQQTLEGVGGMLAVGLSEEAVRPYLTAPSADAIEIAAVNSPNSVTLAGPKEALEQLDAQLVEAEIFSRMLKVEIPYHSSSMDPIRKDLRESLSVLKPQASKIPFYSTVTASILEGEQLQAGYWWNNVRKPVRFRAAFDVLIEDGFELFVELGPHPVLRRSMLESSQGSGNDVRFVSTLVRGENELKRLQRALGELWHYGVNLPFDRYYEGGKYVALPGYPFQREHLWRETVAAEEDRQGRRGHVFFQQAMISSVENWGVGLNQNYFPYMNDHVIQGTPLWSGAGFVESALALNLEKNDGKPVSMGEVSFERMLSLNVSPSQKLITSYDADNLRWSVNSLDRFDSNKWKKHAGGILHDRVLVDQPSVLDMTQLSESMEVVDVEDYYRQLEDVGLEYGQSFRTIKGLYRNSTQAVVELELDESLPLESDSYQIHPALLDGAFQAFLLFADNANHGAWIPVSIESIHFFKAVGSRACASIELTQLSATKCEGSVWLYNSQGETCLILRGAVFRPLPMRTDQLLENLYVPQLMEVKSASLPAASKPEEAWALTVDGGEWAEQVAAMILAESKLSCVQVSTTEAVPALPSSIIQFIYIVDGDSLEQVSDQIMRLIRCVKHAVEEQVPRLTLLTRGAYSISESSEALNLANATVTGLISVLANEYPEIEFRLIDCQEKLDETGQALLLEELSSEFEVNEICLAEQGRLHPVWSTAGAGLLELSRRLRALNPELETARLVPAHDQSLSLLRHVAKVRRDPSGDEVEIEVRSAGLNFKDLLKATSRIAPMATEDTFFGNTLGLECSGVVSRAGASVEDLKVGDRVSAFSRDGCFGDRIIANKSHVTKIADEVSFEDGACFVPWVTAHYGLLVQARLAEGEVVLIHSGAGGVGLAAIQVAHSVGAKVIASASSPAKRDYLSELGVFAVVDSGSLKFVEEVLRCTDGKGVDVVLSALPGQALQQSFRLLSEGGRFIEIGKRDILENRALPMEVFNRNISFISIDLDRILRINSHIFDVAIDYLWAGFKGGQLQALPSQAFPASEPGEAFREMASRERIGRVSLSYEMDTPLLVEEVEEISVREDGCYLITGGTQGLGMAIAKEFAKRGAGQLVLISRSGQIAAGDAEALAAFNPSTEIICRAVDITKPEALRALLDTLNQRGLTLCGVVHCALVLKDQFLKDIDLDSLEAVLRPKVMGADYLDQLLGDQALDFWVNFSSISTLIGNVGQAAYVAANTYLERFAQKRRLAGKPCLTILLGYVADVGVASRDPSVARYLEKAGMCGMDSSMIARRVLGLCGSAEPIIGFFKVNWPQWSQLSFETASWSRFKELLADDPSRLASFKLLELREQLNDLDYDTRIVWMTDRIQTMFSEIMFTSKAKIDVETPISNLGIDSLLVVELMAKFQVDLGVGLSNNDLFQDPSIQKLSRIILEKCGLNG